MEKEIWKDIAGYEGLYQVSNFGKVRKVSVTTVDKTGKSRRQKAKTLKPQVWNYKRSCPGHHGFLVNLWKGGKRSAKTVHRLVAEAFVSNPEGKPQVNHIDGNRTHNWASNLEWVTQSENMMHSVYVLRNSTPLAMRPVKCVETGRFFTSISEAAREIGLSTSAVQAVASGRPQHHTAGGYHWEYAD